MLFETLKLNQNQALKYWRLLKIPKSHPSYVFLQRQITSKVDGCLFTEDFAKTEADFALLN